METALPSLHALAAPSDEALLEERSQIARREGTFRGVLARATCAVVFLACSLMVLSLLPFYPPAMAVFLGIICGALAYRWPSGALAMLLVLAAPAYSYQLGGIVWGLLAMIAVAAALPFALSRLPGAAVGCAVGAAAGALMLTPYFFLALPLLAGVTLLRLKGSSSAGGWGLFMFLIIYVPFLFLAEVPKEPGATVPLFATVEYARQLPLNQLDLESLKAAFQGLMSNDISGFPGFSSYFVRGWGGVVLLLTMLVAILVTPAVLNLRKRVGMRRILFRGLGPLVTLLAIEAVFLVPLLLLEKPLGYHTGFTTWADLAVLTGPLLALGLVGFGAETWLHRRNLRVEFRSDLATLSKELGYLLDICRKRLDEVSSVCHNNDLGDEKALVGQSEEKLALTVETVDAMSLPRLETSHRELVDMRTQLSGLYLQLERKAIGHVEDSRRAYRAIVDEAHALGIPNIQEDILGLPPAPEEQSYETSLAEQRKLNSAFRDLAGKLVSAGDMLATTIKGEFDPEFSLATIDIGHGFLDQGRYEEAARTISEDLQIIDGRIENSIVDLGGRVSAMAADFKKVVTVHLIPVFESIGDGDYLTRCRDAVAGLDTIAGSVLGAKTLADMISIVEHSRQLGDLAAGMVGELRQKIAEIETDNNRRSPPKYNWRNNNHAASDVQELVGSIESAPSEPTIGSRFAVIETDVQALEQQGRVIKRYSQANEFLMNYPNIEYIIQEQLETNKEIDGSALPVRPHYGVEYLKMYAAKNSDGVVFDAKSGTLKNTVSKRTGRNEKSK